MSQPSSRSAFVFGKLPAHGDFVARGLTDPVQNVWDEWATQTMSELRDAGPEFEAAHDATPPWRFIAGPSRMGESWRMGALAPSIDAAGRRFLVVAGIDGASPAFASLFGLAAAAAIEDILYRAIGEGLTVDEAKAAVDLYQQELEEDAALAEALAARPHSPGIWWSAAAAAGGRVAGEPPTDMFAAYAGCITGPGEVLHE